MGLTGWSTANFLRRAAAVVTGYPVMISNWGFRDFTANGAYTLAAADLSTTTLQRFAYTRLVIVPAVVAQIIQYDGTVLTQADDGGTFPTSAWAHFSGCAISTTEREIRLMGGNFGTNATSCAPAAPDQFLIGKNQADEAWGNTAGLAEVSVWNLTGFTLANRTSLDTKLAAGENPLTITAEAAQPWTGRLIAYWPLTNTTTMTSDASGNGHTLTANGTLTNFASHPPVTPAGPAVYVQSAYRWRLNNGSLIAP